jgi:hypothetical protein
MCIVDENPDRPWQIDHQGVPDYEMAGWNAFCAPPDTPQPKRRSQVERQSKYPGVSANIFALLTDEER